MKQPKGLKLFDREESDNNDLTAVIADGNNAYDAIPGCAIIDVSVGGGAFDADQLDKLAERCKAFSKYLRSLPKAAIKKPKWEDL